MAQEILMAVEVNAPVKMSVAGDEPIAMQTVEFIRGGGGTSDYDALTNKPSITGVTLSGNKTAAELGFPSSAADVGAVAVAQGAAKANQFLVTDANGNVTTKTLESWQAQSY